MANRNKLLNVIYRIQADRQTGSLYLEKGEEKITVYFQEGLINAAASNIKPLQLGRFIAKIARVDHSALDRLINEPLGRFITRIARVDHSALDRLITKAWKKRLPLGKAAVNRKLVEETELEDSIRQQIFETLAHALDNEFDVSTFAHSTESFYMPARLDLNRVLLEVARHYAKPFRLEPRQRIVLKSGTGFTGLPLCPQELSVLNELNQPRTLEQLAAVTGLDPASLSKVLGVLNSLHLISASESTNGGETALVAGERLSLRKPDPGNPHEWPERQDRNPAQRIIVRQRAVQVPQGPAL